MCKSAACCCAQCGLSQSGSPASCPIRGNTATLQSENKRLEEENQKLAKKNQELEETVSWMHDLIWDLTQKLHSPRQNSGPEH